MSEPAYDPMRLEEKITLHNGAALTRVRGEAWQVGGELPELFPFHDDDLLARAIEAHRQELANGATYDYRQGRYLAIDPIYTIALIALMEATLKQRKEQTHDECADDAEWERRCGVRG